MSRIKTIPKHQNDIDLQYANWLQQTVLMLQPKNFFGVIGRGGGKTTGILAPRSQDIAEDMPGCYIAVSADTFMNARKNIIPTLVDGWEMNGWREGLHFVVNKRPPNHFKLAYKPPLEFKDSVSIFNGTHFKVLSQDRPSGNAGDSYQHIIADEVKNQAEKKINKLNPAVRGGELKYRKSPYYGGRTFTTDMPNTNHGEHDWILRMDKNMDRKQIRLMILCAYEINYINLELYKAIQDKSDHQIQLITKKRDRWLEKFRVLRKNSTFFYIASSFVNVDFLGYDYFKEQLETMLFSEVSSAILSLKPQLEKGLKFYPNLTNKNFYRDSFVYKRIDLIDYREEIQELSLDLKYINHHQAIEGGLDTGNMCSLVTGQDQGKINRILKEFHTIPPDFLQQLGKQFRDFYAHHKAKHLKLWHDRGANNYQSVGEDHASKFQQAIEYDEHGNSTGWIVTLMSRNQETIFQQTEYELALEMMQGNHKSLPDLLIDQNTCKCLKSSLERAEKIIKVKPNGVKTTHKDKSSEKLPVDRLPMESTNMSDALKYYLCRDEYLEKIKGQLTSFSGLPRTN